MSTYEMRMFADVSKKSKKKKILTWGIHLNFTLFGLCLIML